MVENISRFTMRSFRKKYAVLSDVEMLYDVALEFTSAAIRG